MTRPDLTDPRRKRLLFRAWHRGTKEMDLILGRFADAHLAAMDDGELDAFEALLNEADVDLMAWLMKRAPVPSERDSALFQRLRREVARP